MSTLHNGKQKLKGFDIYQYKPSVFSINCRFIDFGNKFAEAFGAPKIEKPDDYVYFEETLPDLNPPRECPSSPDVLTQHTFSRVSTYVTSWARK